MSDLNQQPPGGESQNEGQGRKKTCVRGGRMKYFVGALVIAVIGLVGAGAIAKNVMHDRWHEGGFERVVDHKLDHLLDGVEATEEQRTKVKAILGGVTDEVTQLYQDTRGDKKAMVTALTGNAVDLQKAESLRAERVAAMDQASQRVLQAVAEAAQVLTPDQRAIIAAWIAEHDRHHDHD